MDFSNVTEEFAEGVIGLSLSDGCVRLLFGKEDTKDACAGIMSKDKTHEIRKQGEIAPSHCVTLTVQGLMQLVGVLGEFMQDEDTQKLLGVAQEVMASMTQGSDES